MKRKDMLSPNFSIREMTRSGTAARRGIDNTAPDEARRALKVLALAVLEPVRAAFGPVIVTSGYRSPELNRAIKGSRNSQHMTGHAVDFEVPGVSNARVAKWISTHLDYDCLILEFHDPTDPHAGWVHCSYVGASNRRKILTAQRIDGKVVYLEGLS